MLTDCSHTYTWQGLDQGRASLAERLGPLCIRTHALPPGQGHHVTLAPLKILAPIAANASHTQPEPSSVFDSAASSSVSSGMDSGSQTAMPALPYSNQHHQQQQQPAPQPSQLGSPLPSIAFWDSLGGGGSSADPSSELSYSQQQGNDSVNTRTFSTDDTQRHSSDPLWRRFLISSLPESQHNELCNELSAILVPSVTPIGEFATVLSHLRPIEYVTGAIRLWEKVRQAVEIRTGFLIPINPAECTYDFMRAVSHIEFTDNMRNTFADLAATSNEAFDFQFPIYDSSTILFVFCVEVVSFFSSFSRFLAFACLDLLPIDLICPRQAHRHYVPPRGGSVVGGAPGRPTFRDIAWITAKVPPCLFLARCL